MTKILRYCKCSHQVDAEVIGPAMIVLKCLALLGLLGLSKAIPKPLSDLNLPEDRIICWIWEENWCLADTNCP